MKKKKILGIRRKNRMSIRGGVEDDVTGPECPADAHASLRGAR